MKSSHHEPSVSIPQGLTIGYPGKRLNGSQQVRLAETIQSIKLTPGRHLLLARNGRGKTTFLKSVAGIIPTLDGKIDCSGTVQFVDEDLRFDAEMKPKQIFSALFKNGLRAFALEMAERIDLDIEKPYGKLSKGNRQKVGLIVAETWTRRAGPQILLLDEPFSGLDFAAREAVDTIWNENQENIVRIVCVHPDEPTLKADTALMIRDGELQHVEVEGVLDWMETKTALT